MTALVVGIALLGAGIADPTFNGLDLLGWVLTVVGAVRILAAASNRRSTR